jgi:hypothetical protein
VSRIDSESWALTDTVAVGLELTGVEVSAEAV